jgi:hypothetical protein
MLGQGVAGSLCPLLQRRAADQGMIHMGTALEVMDALMAIDPTRANPQGRSQPC